MNVDRNRRSHTCTLGISSLSVEHVLQCSISVVLHVSNSGCHRYELLLHLSSSRDCAADNSYTCKLYLLHLFHICLLYFLCAPPDL